MDHLVPFFCGRCGRRLGWTGLEKDPQPVSVYCDECAAEIETEAEEEEEYRRCEQEEAEADELQARMEDYFESRYKELYGHA